MRLARLCVLLWPRSLSPFSIYLRPPPALAHSQPYRAADMSDLGAAILVRNSTRHADVIASDQGNRITPWVQFGDKERLIGEAANLKAGFDTCPS
ncbi:hypothetical protein FRC08_006046 [Ceratobasidium sp. 394]|nr:hypothetical protein FRC08_006046 [Ceratobasidium sp. 394]